MNASSELETRNKAAKEKGLNVLKCNATTKGIEGYSGDFFADCRWEEQQSMQDELTETARHFSTKKEVVKYVEKGDTDKIAMDWVISTSMQFTDEARNGYEWALMNDDYEMIEGKEKEEGEEVEKEAIRSLIMTSRLERKEKGGTDDFYEYTVAICVDPYNGGGDGVGGNLEVLTRLDFL